MPSRSTRRRSKPPPGWKAMVVVPLAVGGLWATVLSLGWLTVRVLGIPVTLSFPAAIRLIGLLILVAGLFLLKWVLTYRKAWDVLVSTYVTFSKMIRGGRLEDKSGRREQLVVGGPYRYVRHPLYLGVVLAVVGLWLLLDYSFLAVSATLLFLWFNFLVAPFEEGELNALFGPDYERYARQVPRLIPFRRPSTRIE